MGVSCFMTWWPRCRRLCLKSQSRRLICNCVPYGPTGNFFERSSMVGSSISGANGSSMRHAKNMPCTNHHGTYVRSMAVDMYELFFELFFPWIWCLNWITPFPYIYIYIYIYLFYYDCLHFSLKHWRKKIQNDIVATRKTEKRKIRRTRWETEKERMHWCDGVQLFETLKRILKSVRDNWNKLDRWERLVHVGGFGKWESEFQEGSLSLITQNVGFIYKNAKNDLFIYL